MGDLVRQCQEIGVSLKARVSLLPEALKVWDEEGELRE
jgi:hypothetical protein